MKKIKFDFDDFFETVLSLLGLAAALCLIIGLTFGVIRDNKAYKNMQRYCVENEVTCNSGWGSYVFIFSNGDFIGSQVMADYYKE